MIVWICNPFDNLPIEGYRPQRYWLMSQAFARAGHEVVLWSSDFSHALKRKRIVSKEHLLEAAKQIGPDARLVLVPTLAYKRNISFARIRSHRAFSKSWKHQALRLVSRGLISKPDAIIVSSPPLSLAPQALELKEEFECKVVIDIQDAWPETFYRVLPLPKKFREKIGSFLFARTLRTSHRALCAADAVTAAARRYLATTEKIAPPAQKRMLCHLGIQLPPHFLGPAQFLSRKLPFGANRNFQLVYVGTMGKSYDLKTVIRAVRDIPGVELHLAGAGPDEKELRLEAKPCRRIFFHGYLRAAEIRTLLLKSDAAVIPMFPDSYVGLPGKTADYAAAGLPVINSLGGETAYLVEKYSCGVKYEAGSVPSFKDAFLKLAASADVFNSMRANALKMAKMEFDADSLYDGYAAFVEDLFPQSPAEEFSQDEEDI